MPQPEIEFIETFVPELDNTMFLAAVAVGCVIGGIIAWGYIQNKAKLTKSVAPIVPFMLPNEEDVEDAVEAN